MSRIGIKPVKIAENLNVELSPTLFKVTGPLGELKVNIPHGVTVAKKDDQIIVSRISDVKLYKALHGTIRSLIANAVAGVDKGFEKKLEMVGIGYRAALEDNELVLQVGYTHPVRLHVPEGLTAKVEKNVITVSGRDKHMVGQFAAIVRSSKKPDRYKGKGIRYQGEIIRLKPGKAAAKTAA
ncbi:MAG TPA: 50S ribosomal protein L6 [Candidatus Saccharimonadales bacterium]|nr:50S ribosomal protein L6 [Candidatus Saccharimonadales bacterium]